MEVEEPGKVEEGGDGTQRSLGSLEFLTQDTEPSGTTLVDTHNGFNKLSRLEMLWTVRHHWPSGARFAFNCYRHWAQLLIRQLRELPVTILIREGVIEEDPLLMVLYWITLAPFAKELRVVDPGFYPLYMRTMRHSTVRHDILHSS